MESVLTWIFKWYAIYLRHISFTVQVSSDFKTNSITSFSKLINKLFTEFEVIIIGMPICKLFVFWFETNDTVIFVYVCYFGKEIPHIMIGSKNNYIWIKYKINILSDDVVCNYLLLKGHIFLLFSAGSFILKMTDWFLSIFYK